MAYAVFEFAFVVYLTIKWSTITTIVEFRQCTNKKFATPDIYLSYQKMGPKTTR